MRSEPSSQLASARSLWAAKAASTSSQDRSPVVAVGVSGEPRPPVVRRARTLRARGRRRRREGGEHASGSWDWGCGMGSDGLLPARAADADGEAETRATHGTTRPAPRSARPRSGGRPRRAARPGRRRPVRGVRPAHPARLGPVGGTVGLLGDEDGADAIGLGVGEVDRRRRATRPVWSTRSSSSGGSRDEAHAESESPSARRPGRDEAEGSGMEGIRRGSACGSRLRETEREEEPSRRRRRGRAGQQPDDAQSERPPRPRRTRGAAIRVRGCRRQRDRGGPAVGVGEHGARRRLALADVDNGLLALDAVEALDRYGQVARAVGELGDELGIRLVATQAEPDVADRQRRAVGRQAKRPAEVVGDERLVAVGFGVDRVAGGVLRARAWSPACVTATWTVTRDPTTSISTAAERASWARALGARSASVRARRRPHRNVKACDAEAPTTHDGTFGASVAETW